MKIKSFWFFGILLSVVLDLGGAIQKGSIIGKKCQYVLREKSLEFTSPGYPEFYPNKAKCKWTIIAEPGYHIHLTIIDVKIEESKHCEFDAVTVYDGEGDTAIPIRKLCGTKSPESLQSVSNVFTIVMETDGYGNGEGFQMKYSTVPSCMVASLGETGEMKSPGYPLGYPDGVSCNFHFPLIEVGKFIHIYFEDFQLEQIQHYECFDHLSIITLSEKGDEKIEGQFCGTTLKEKSLCFNTGQLSMRLVTDRMWNTRGFKVSYLITDDVCSEKDNISLLIDDTIHTVELTDIQVLQQLLDRELNGGSLTSSVAVDKINIAPAKSAAAIVVPPQPSLPTVEQLQSSVKLSPVTTPFITSEMIQPSSELIVESFSTLSLSTISHLQSSKTTGTKQQNFTSSDIIKDSSVSKSINQRAEQSFPNPFSSSMSSESSNNIKPVSSMSNPSQNTKHVFSEILQSSFPENSKINSHEFVTPPILSQISSNHDDTSSILNSKNAADITERISSSQMDYMISSTTLTSHHTVEQTSILNSLSGEVISSRRSGVISSRNSYEVITETSQFIDSSKLKESTGLFNAASLDVGSKIESESTFNKEIHATAANELFKGKLELTSKIEIEMILSKGIHSTTTELSKRTPESSSKIDLETVSNKEIHLTTSINTQALKSVYAQHEQMEISSQLTISEEPIQITSHSALPQIISSFEFQHEIESSSKKQLHQSTPLGNSPISTIQATPLESLFEPSKVGVHTKQLEEKMAYSSTTRPPSLRSKSQFAHEEQPPQPPEDISSRRIVLNTTPKYNNSTMSEINIYSTLVTYKGSLESSTSNKIPSDSNSIITNESTFEVFPSSKTFHHDSYIITISNSEQQSGINKITSFKSTHSKTRVIDSSYVVPTSSIPILLTSTIQPLISTSSKTPENSKSKEVTPKRKCNTYLKFELHAGQLPLNRLTKKAKELIQNAFQSHVNDVHEVAWPHEKIVGKRGIMNYGSLLTTNKGGMFLLRVVQNHIHLVEITDDVMRAYEMEKLMLLPSQNKNETLRKYLHKISATIKVSLLFC